MSLDKVDDPAQRLLKLYKERGTPVNMASKPWILDQISAALSWGVHQSCMEHTKFLHEEVHNVILKSQWVVPTAEDVAHLPELRISPPQVLCRSKTDDCAGCTTTTGHR